MYEKSIFIFRRDLRYVDNVGLTQALERSQQVLPCFIFDPRQVQIHAYHSAPGFEFMKRALKDLDGLKTFDGLPVEVLALLREKYPFEAIFLNRDYTPFSRARDEEIAQFAKEVGVSLHVSDDALLNSPEDVLKDDGKPYSVFTPFWKTASKNPVKKPCSGSNWPSKRPGLKILEGNFSSYEKERDFPAQDATSRLSVHLKFGTISIREAYYRLPAPMQRQLYWRDFFTHIAYHYPHVFGEPFHEKYAQIPWKRNPHSFQLWCEGKTGYPMVDAGMRELKATGYMHNRCRMITASFLVKDLHIDWRWGERYFATKLMDYDPCVNNGNWQWAASTGCDAVPYFRIFNPERQQERFDPNGHYVNRWAPDSKDIPPIVDHKVASELTKKMFKA